MATFYPAPAPPPSEDVVATTVTADQVTADEVYAKVNEKTILAVATGDGTTYAAFSSDGITWTEALMPDGSQAIDHGAAYGGGKFVVISRGKNTAAITTDGTNWTEGTLPGDERMWEAIAYGDGKFVAVARGVDKAAYSTDGVTWSEGDLPAVKNWNTVVYGGGVFITTAQSNSSGAYSTDGITWVSRSLNGPNNMDNVAFGQLSADLVPAWASGGRFVFLDRIRYRYTDIIESTGLPTSFNSGFHSDADLDMNWTCVAYGADKFVAIARSPYGSSAVTDVAIYSADAITWTQTTMPVAANWRWIEYFDGKFVAFDDGDVAGGSNVGAYSTDGITWTAMTMPSTQKWWRAADGELEKSTNLVSFIESLKTP